MIGLQNSKFFKDYAFLDAYFKEFMDENDYLLIKRQINLQGEFSPSRNTKTLMALIVLSSYNKAEIVENLETEKVVRINADKYFSGSGFDLNGIQVKLQECHEAKQYQKFLKLTYFKKDGTKCSLYFDWFDKAYVEIKVNKPTSTPTKTPTEKVIQTPTKTPTKKVTPTPAEEKVTKKKQKEKTVTPTPTPVEEKITPTPTYPPKDPSKGTQGDIVKPQDNPGPGEFTGGTVTPVEKSTKEEDKDSTDFTTIEDYEKKIAENKPEVTTVVTPIVTQTEICETGEKVEIKGKIDDNGDQPKEPGIAPIDAATPTKAPVQVDGEDIKNNPDNPVDKKMGLPPD